MPARLVPPRSPITNSLTGRAVLESCRLRGSRTSGAPSNRSTGRAVSVAGSSPPRRAPSRPRPAIHVPSARGLHGLGDSAPLCSALLQEWVDAFERERDLVDGALRRAARARSRRRPCDAERLPHRRRVRLLRQISAGYESVLGLLIRELNWRVASPASRLSRRTPTLSAPNEREVVLLCRRWRARPSRRWSPRRAPSAWSSGASPRVLASSRTSQRPPSCTRRSGASSPPRSPASRTSSASSTAPVDRPLSTTAVARAHRSRREGGRPPPGVALFWSN